MYYEIVVSRFFIFLARVSIIPKHLDGIRSNSFSEFFRHDSKEGSQLDATITVY